MEAKALCVDTAFLRRLLRLAGDGLQLSTFCPAPGPERKAVGAGRRLRGPERGLRIVGQIAHPLLFNQIAFACQQSHEALYDPAK